MNIKQIIQALPKAELHVHIEGTFEPELMFGIAKRNRIAIPYENVDAVRQAYDFHNLQRFWIFIMPVPAYCCTRQIFTI